MRHTTRLAGIAVASLWAASVTAQGGGPPPHPMRPPVMDDGAVRAGGALWHADGLSAGSFLDGPGMMVPLMLRHADLTAEQQQRVRQIMDGDRGRLHRLFAELDAANDALASKVVAPGALDPAALKPEVEYVARVRQDLMEQELRTALAIRAVLTPAQLDKAARTQARLRELQEEMRQLLESEATTAER